MAKRRVTTRKRPTISAVDRLLIGEFSPTAKLIALVTALAALAYIFDLARPVLDSGPLPFPARVEVSDLRTETTEQFKGVKIGLDQTLELAKAANFAAQQAIQESRVNRLTRLLQQSVQIQALIEMNPTDLALKQILEQTKADIARLSAEASRQQTDPALIPVPAK